MAVFLHRPRSDGYEVSAREGFVDSVNETARFGPDLRS